MHLQYDNLMTISQNKKNIAFKLSLLHLLPRPDIIIILLYRYRWYAIGIYTYTFSSYPEPRVYFDRAKYIVDENADICQVTVKRAGSDLSRPSSVVIRSKKTHPVSAKGTYKI
jgi:hypothetical protein